MVQSLQRLGFDIYPLRALPFSSMRRRYMYRPNKSILAVKGEDGLVDWQKGVAYFSRQPSTYLRYELEDAGYTITIGRPPRKRRARLKRRKHR